MVLGKEILYLTKADVISLGITMQEFIDQMEIVYKEKGADRVTMPPKMPMHPLIENGPHGHLTAMPALIPAIGAAGVKQIGGFASNIGTDVDYITGLYILNDVKTGAPICVMDCVWLTGLRTGAVTGVSAKYLARKDSKVVTIIGCGMQGRVSLDALMCELDELEEIYVTDINQATVDRYLKEKSEEYPSLKIMQIENMEAAIRKSDIIVTCVPSDIDEKYQVIKREWLKKEGLTIFPVDVGVSFEPDCLTESDFDKWYVDDIDQYKLFRSEDYVKYGPENPPRFGQMLNGMVPARENEKENICPVNIGTGVGDLGAAKLIYDRAVAMNVGTILPL